jgi:hypothetical protein
MNKDEYEEDLTFFLHKNAYKHFHVEKIRKLLFEISECCVKFCPDGILITKSKYSNLINTITRSEIRNGRKYMNNKSKKDISQKLFIYDDKECDIDDILQDKKIPEGEVDNFDDLYSIIKKLNFKNIKENDKIFTIENNENYSNYKNKFEKIWNKKYI